MMYINADAVPIRTDSVADAGRAHDLFNAYLSGLRAREVIRIRGSVSD